jgi:hypothetical protein
VEPALARIAVVVVASTAERRMERPAELRSAATVNISLSNSHRHSCQGAVVRKGLGLRTSDSSPPRGHLSSSILWIFVVLGFEWAFSSGQAEGQGQTSCCSKESKRTSRTRTHYLSLEAWLRR